MNLMSNFLYIYISLTYFGEGGGSLALHSSMLSTPIINSTNINYNMNFTNINLEYK